MSLVVLSFYSVVLRPEKSLIEIDVIVSRLVKLLAVVFFQNGSHLNTGQVNGATHNRSLVFTY